MTTTAGSATPESAVLRALWLTETFPPSRGGMAQSCDRIVRGLRRTGVGVDVLHFTPRPHRRPFAIENQAGGRYLTCPIEGDPAHALNRAWSVLQSDLVTPAVTHVVAFGGSRPITAAPVYAAWLGVPLITLIRGNDFDAAVFSTRRRPVLDAALARSALVCAVSQDKVEKIAAMHPGVRVQRIPNGIERRDWELAPSDRARAAAWRQANVAAGARVIGLFGQLKAKKGGVLLLEALRRSGVAEQFHLLLAGWLEPDMEEWLQAHGEEIRFTLLPFLDRYELLPWYAACDWIAIPSFYDGLPNVLIEAAVLGVPMLASRVGGMADVLEDGRTALLFEPGDEAGCIWALQRAARLSEPERSVLGEACRALAETELDAELETARYVEALSAA
ncbi:MAG: glycosyltransferase family 4 protein [Solirubrobacteraceae bacterium]